MPIELPTGWTPGRWYGRARGSNLIVQGAAGECLAVIPSPQVDGHGIVTKAERCANMELLALAPSMAAEITRLTEENERLRGVLGQVSAYAEPHRDGAGGALDRIAEITRAFTQGEPT